MIYFNGVNEFDFCIYKLYIFNLNYYEKQNSYEKIILHFTNTSYIKMSLTVAIINYTLSNSKLNLII